MAMTCHSIAGTSNKSFWSNVLDCLESCHANISPLLLLLAKLDFLLPGSRIRMIKVVSHDELSSMNMYFSSLDRNMIATSQLNYKCWITLQFQAFQQHLTISGLLCGDLFSWTFFLELETNEFKVLQSRRKPLLRAFSWLEAPTSTSTYLGFKSL